MSNRFFALALLLALPCVARKPTLTMYESIDSHMGTLFSIKVYAPDASAAKAAFTAAFARVAQLDDRLSDYKPDSELNLATKAAYSHPVHISDDLATVLEASLKMSQETGGAFDVTVGPLTKLWRQARHDRQMPTPEAIAAARAKVGYQKLHLDSAAQTMQVDLPDMQLDLGAIAKGYAAEQALSVITHLGIKSALVAASGDLAFSAAPPGQPGWKIGVGTSDKVLTLTNAAVSTSGASEQNLEAGGVRYSHIIDPKTGVGLTNDITVTVVSRHGIDADAADTAVSVLGCEKGLALIETHPELAAFILEKAGGRVHAIESARFRRLPH
jgi:thiamine biosynthesis lipoprotein